MDVHSLKVVDIVALTAIVLSLMCPASKSIHIVTSSPKPSATHGIKLCAEGFETTSHSARKGSQCVSESVREAQVYPLTLPSGDAVSRSLYTRTSAIY